MTFENVYQSPLFMNRTIKKGNLSGDKITRTHVFEILTVFLEGTECHSIEYYSTLKLASLIDTFA